MNISPREFFEGSQALKMRKLLFLLLLLSFSAGADQLKSGLNVGDDTPAYHPTHITGPDAGTTVCPV